MNKLFISGLRMLHGSDHRREITDGVPNHPLLNSLILFIILIRSPTIVSSYIVLLYQSKTPVSGETSLLQSDIIITCYRSRIN